MIKKILGVIVGYIGMLIFIMATFSIAFILLGTKVTYHPDSYEVSLVWIVVSAILGFVGAILGGLICKLISKNSFTVKTFAAIILFLGLALFVVQITSTTPMETRTGDISNSEAMAKSQQPLWFSFVNPFLSVAGILIGGVLINKSEEIN